MPVELPNWHIESKATQKPGIPASKLKSWCRQIATDCPAGKLPVILHVANGFEPVALMLSDVYKSVAQVMGSLTICTEASFAPAIELAKLEKGARIYCTLMDREPPRASASVAFEPEVGTVIVAISANTWLGWAKVYEEKLKHVKDEIAKDLKQMDADAEKPKLELVK